jgi:hypothetical protein
MPRISNPPAVLTRDRIPIPPELTSKARLVMARQTRPIRSSFGQQRGAETARPQPMMVEAIFTLGNVVRQDEVHTVVTMRDIDRVRS